MSAKHVLIVCYYWPPAGGPGVQRWLKFTKYLPDNDITPIVYCPENPNYPIQDKSLIEEIPENLEVLKTKIKEPYKFADKLSRKKASIISSGIIPKDEKQSIVDRLLLFIRGNFFIPDARKNWVKPSVEYLSKILEKRSIHCVITTGPPHSLHLIGLGLKRQLDITWIADFRDPWTTIGYHESLKLLPIARRKHELLEKQVLNTADEIIVTSQHTRNEFSNKTEKPITVITNGYDSHDIPKKTTDVVFSISHIGSLLSDRNPIILWEILSELIQEHQDIKRDLKLNLVGVVSEDVIKTMHSLGLTEYVNLVGYVSHREAIEYQMRTQLLLLIEINSKLTRAIIPGKLFEYMYSERPILAMGPENSDVETIINNTNTGRYFSYDAKQELKQFIINSYEKFKEGELYINPIGINQYSRKELTKKLASVLAKYV
jgi:hypothetical protein